MGTVQGRGGEGETQRLLPCEAEERPGLLEQNRAESGGQRGDVGEGRFICLGVI